LEVTITSSNVEDARLRLSPGTEVRGTVRVEGGSPAALFRNGSQNPQEALAVGLIDAEGIGITVPGAAVDSQGKFRLQGVPQGRYILDLGGVPPGIYLKSARVDGQEITHSLLDLTEAAEAAIEVVLAPNAPVVSGVVRNDKGEPAARVVVSLWPKVPDLGSLSDGLKTATTDENGGFRFTGIAPGAYYLAAWEEVTSGLPESREFRSQFTSAARALTLQEGQQETADVSVISRDAVALAAAKLP